MTTPLSKTPFVLVTRTLSPNVNSLCGDGASGTGVATAAAVAVAAGEAAASGAGVADAAASGAGVAEAAASGVGVALVSCFLLFPVWAFAASKTTTAITIRFMEVLGIGALTRRSRGFYHRGVIPRKSRGESAHSSIFP